MPDLVHQQTLYVREKYHGKPLMVSFWHQLMAVKNTHASTMLEVGVHQHLPAAAWGRRHLR
jgi:hypothetical protein